jgi:DNA sulfur modification protein DndD
MLLREITLHNFGGYRGRHSIDLVPPDEARPIVLFGGLNGAGKTTLLDAMQLVLYGKRARCAGRGNLGYEDYLRRCVNRSVAAREGAALELAFEAVFDGSPSVFRVHRSWEAHGNGVREHLHVSRDDIDSILLTERWDEIVEELMPLDIASLFFFDGEKIEALADPERAGLVIATAVESLLGLGLLERLQVDLVALERKKRTSAADSVAREELDVLAAKIAGAEAELAYRVQERAARRNDLDRAESDLAQHRDRFRQHGGELFEQRGEIERRRDALADQLREVREELHEIAAGSLPLRLVAPLLAATVHQVESERGADHNESVIDDLHRRDEAMLDALGATLSKAARARFEAFVATDNSARREQIDVPRYLDVDNATAQRLAFVWPAELDRLADRGSAVLEREASLSAEVEDLDRLLAAVPAAAAVAALSIACEGSAVLVAEARARFTVACEGIEAAERTIADLQAKRERVLSHAADAIAAEEDGRRIVEHAAKVRATLVDFRRELLARHLSRIEAAILESLHRLLRKQRLVADLRLDPETFALTLFDPDGNKMSTERLSAGERQLLAVALLWGLARVSGRQLPTIIDTPLGRLDSVHRRLIAERYFPHASSQVLLLSTDEEIDEQLLKVIQPAVGRAYELRYDDATTSTTVVDGYFFDRKAADVA